MKKIFILWIMFLTNSAFAFYNFDKVNYYFDQQFAKLQHELNGLKSNSFSSSNSSMQYFDKETNNYIIKIRTTINKEYLDIKTHKNYIIISGKENKDNAKSEFSQTMSLPKDADVNNIKADHEDKILTISIPKLKQEKQFKSIKIN